jgi:4'-phosphopantetheinyl transferase
MIELGIHDVHVWCYNWREPPLESVIEPLYSILCGAERERFHRFHFERDRHAYLLAHGLVRLALSRYRRVHPRDWTFAPDINGKPFITGPSLHPLKFNLTHSAGIVACAIAERMDVGVDAENMGRTSSLMDVARAVFAPEELRSLEQTRESGRAELFFTYWTLKEAYVKARGLGLSMPLDQFAFFVDGTESPRIEFHRGLEDDPGDWQFRLFRIDIDRLLSVAAHSRRAQAAIVLNSAAPIIESSADLV